MATPPKTTPKPLKLSRYQLDMFVKCPRCFWLLKKHGIKQPEGYPLALNIAMDHLLKEEFDQHRQQGTLPPILECTQLPMRLFTDTAKLEVWRNNFKGVSWTDPETGCILFGAVDDILVFESETLAVLDYKSSGARAARVYPSYQLQLDIYTFLLQKQGYQTCPNGYMAVFLADKTQGFQGRLPFRPELLEVPVDPDRVYPLFLKAIEQARSETMPDSGPECDVCRFSGQATDVLRFADINKRDLFDA